jgi:esterase/lipase
MRKGLWLIFLLVICTLPLTVHAADRFGIVLIHGKGGGPQQLTPLAEALAARGHLTDLPEMCWSRSRIYDRLYLDCLRDIDAAAGRLKARGATAIVVLGMSLGGNAALSYGASRPGLKGLITLVAAHAPEFIGLRPEVAASLMRARALIAAGQGDAKTEFADVNTRTASYNFLVITTPHIYVSFFAPESPALMPANAARLTAPLLYVTASNDPSQRGREYIYARVPANPLNRYAVVTSDHIGTPAAAREAVLGWIQELAGL